MVNSNNHVKPNPRLRLVELWLGWGFHNFPKTFTILVFVGKAYSASVVRDSESRGSRDASASKDHHVHNYIYSLPFLIKIRSTN